VGAIRWGCRFGSRPPWRLQSNSRHWDRGRARGSPVVATTQFGAADAGPPPCGSGGAREVMNFMQEGRNQLLDRSANARSAQERTAGRTRQMLVAARLCFVFSHGALAIAISAMLGFEADLSWWAVFIPVWLGDTLSGTLCVLSWFASCPYIKLCLTEKTARSGDANPSILTDILPDIVWAILGLFFVCIALTGEVLYYQYLDAGNRGEKAELWPSVMAFMICSVLACTRGILVKRSAAAAFFGFAVLFTSLGALLHAANWVLVMPSAVSLVCLIKSNIDRLRHCMRVLSREEQLLRIWEMVVMSVVIGVLIGLAIVLAIIDSDAAEGQRRMWHQFAGTLGIAAGTGVCTVAAIRARMALVESRQYPLVDRLLSLQANAQTTPIQVPPLIDNATQEDSGHGQRNAQ